MTNALKGALLSGLILPGLGQFALKRPVRGLVIMSVVLGCLTIAVIKTVHIALAILEKLAASGEIISLSAITDATHQATRSPENMTINVTLLVAVLLWLISIVDAYLIGKKLDREAMDQDGVAGE